VGGAVFLSAVALMAPAASAQPAAQNAKATSERSLEEWIERLDAPSLEVRETATLAVSGMGEELAQYVTPERLEALSAEQRERIETILRQRFFASPRAGLGVSFRPLLENGLSLGVRIERVVDGFPAKEFLEPGDVIVEIDGQSLKETTGLRSDTALRHAILSRDPGEPISVVVQRDDERLAMEIPTGSFEQLREALRPDARLLQGAWRWRMDRVGLETGGTLRMDEAAEARWRGNLRQRSDIPALAPAGRPAAALAAEMSVPVLAEPGDDRGLNKRLLLMQGRIRHLEQRIDETQQTLALRRRELRAALAESKEAMRLRSEIRDLERQVSIDRLQLQRLLTQMDR
jgi:hypothetical protein